MKVLLINPYTHDAKLHRQWIKIAAITEPLGLCYLASYLRMNGFDTAILDCYANNITLDEIVKRTLLMRPDLIGITCTTPSFGVVAKIAEAIKERIRDIPIVVGGSHPTIQPDEILRMKCIDYVVRGEGEVTLLDLVRCLDSQINMRQVHGLSYRRGAEMIHNIDRDPVQSLDQLPFPARDLLDQSKYHNALHHEIDKPSFTVLGSRGCIFDCSFCSHKYISKNRRTRSPKNIIAEIYFLEKEYHAKQINFVDPIFPVSEAEGILFCEEMMRAGLHNKVAWLCQTNAYCVTEKLLKKMRKAGCRKVIFGIESGNEKVLKSIGKQHTLQEVRNAVAWANAADIEPIGLFIIGFPGEMEEMVQETLTFSRSLGLKYAKYNRLVPYVGTKIYDFIKKQNPDSLPANWGAYIPYPFLFIESTKTYTPDKISSECLNKLQWKAYIKFYCRPKLLWWLLKKFRLRQSLHIIVSILSALRMEQHHE